MDLLYLETIFGRIGVVRQRGSSSPYVHMGYKFRGLVLFALTSLSPSWFAERRKSHVWCDNAPSPQQEEKKTKINITGIKNTYQLEKREM